MHLPKSRKVSLPPKWASLQPDLEKHKSTRDVQPEYEDMYTPMDLRTIQDWIVRRRLSGLFKFTGSYENAIQIKLNYLDNVFQYNNLLLGCKSAPADKSLMRAASYL